MQNIFTFEEIKCHRKPTPLNYLFYCWNDSFRSPKIGINDNFIQKKILIAIERGLKTSIIMIS